MRIHPLELVAFSPTGGTRRILESVGDGLGASERSLVDLTLPASVARRAPSEGRRSGLALIGVPVYAGRVPALAVERLRQQVRGEGRPAVLVVVYGNRAFEDALLELRNLAEELGFVPVAGAAFIGEHSYSTPEAPVAQGRPDAGDHTVAEAFGRQVREQLEARTDLGTRPRLQVPGTTPHRDGVARSDASPTTLADGCGLCGACAAVCPSAAVRLEDGAVVTDKALCLHCCACTRACPNGARVMADPRILAFGHGLHTRCAQRREPELFL